MPAALGCVTKIPNSRYQAAMSDTEKSISTPRAVLEAVASAAFIAGLGSEQQAYEKWLDDVDYRGPWPQIPWGDLSSETRSKWQRTLQDTSTKSTGTTCRCHPFHRFLLIFIVPDMNETKFITKPSSRSTVNSTYRKREWSASSNGDPEIKNRPKCPLCTSLKKSIPCRGGPPCTECKRKGYSASECQNYVPGQGNKGRRRMVQEGGEKPHKRPRVRAKPVFREQEAEVGAREVGVAVPLLGSVGGVMTPPESCNGIERENEE